MQSTPARERGFNIATRRFASPTTKTSELPGAIPSPASRSICRGGPIRDLIRDITGDRDIRFADAQATAFSPGDFLTGHDDRFAGKDRRAAYVLGLTPVWRLEWGGLLIMRRRWRSGRGLSANDEHAHAVSSAPDAQRQRSDARGGVSTLFDYRLVSRMTLPALSLDKLIVDPAW